KKKKKKKLPTIQTVLRRRSKATGVMITQYVADLPEGKTIPDFQCKPAAVTIQEGKVAVFKATVNGDPKPDVSWRRAKGTISNKDKFQSKYDDSTGEYILEIRNVSVDDTDTYKCCAVNEYGKAVCPTTLTVNEGKSGRSQTFLYACVHLEGTSLSLPLNICLKIFSKTERGGGETDERFWEVMLKADRKDYERICSDFGVVDLHLALKKVEEKKREKKQKRSKDDAIPLNEDREKQTVQNIGRIKDFGVKVLVFLSVSKVEFVIKIQEIKVQEGDNALFECVLTHPLPRITWMGKGIVLKAGEKYGITVTDHKLIHRLLIRDCQQLDKGIYSAVAGITSCSAWLVVEDEGGPASNGNKDPCKTTLALGAGTNLEKLAREQQMKNQEEREIVLAGIKARHMAGEQTLASAGRESEMTRVTGLGENAEAVKDKPDAAKDDAMSERTDNPGVHFICGLSDVNAIMDQTAELSCKLSSEECEGAWFKDGKKISPDDHFTITKDGAIHKMVIIKCTEEHSGKYRFEADGRKTEAMVNVKDPPRFDPENLQTFCDPVTVKVGHNAIFKLHFVGHEPITIQWYREGEELHDDSITRIEKSTSHSRLLLSRCQRKDTGEIKIKLKNQHGFTEETSQLIVLDKPTPPQGPADVTESSASCIEFRWRPPKDDGGSPVINYTIERRQAGRNTWKKLGESPGVPSYRDTDVENGRKYCYRIRAVTREGTSETMETEDMQAGTLAFPGPPAPPKVISTSDDCINLSWDSPSKTGGSRILGYILEKRKKGSNLWKVVNAMDELIKEKKYAVKDVMAGMAYEFRLTAINLSGAGEFSNASEFVFARDPKMRPKFTNHTMKSFMVVRAGNSVRITVNFEASPVPDIMWLKDNVPVTRRATVSNSDGSSQLLITSSERYDSGIYSVLVKNLVGQETFSTEVRVTDDPKPPGPVELEENVPGTVTVIWEPSPDEKRDDRLHYTVSKLDSTKRAWTTVADRLFNNKFTVCNIMQGREYHFRIYAKNDIGISAPSESPTWGIEKKKEKFVVNVPSGKDCDLLCAPTFIVPLKLHTAPKGYECYMSCAVKGNPKPRITWYRNHVSLNTNTNYYISNTCGVCSMLILRVGTKDMGEYSITAENALGRAECSTALSVRGGTHTHTSVLRFQGREKKKKTYKMM
uniref:Immunoglobulin like and fibronectin type III domain containing 1, tandem duplicate 3 n=1 Tax=Echeneis naucrates TaxID=173247 RepID=A0A665WF64_ECHNA